MKIKILLSIWKIDAINLRPFSKQGGFCWRTVELCIMCRPSTEMVHASHIKQTDFATTVPACLRKCLLSSCTWHCIITKVGWTNVWCWQPSDLFCRLCVEWQKPSEVHKLEPARTGQPSRATAVCWNVFYRRLGWHWLLLCEAVHLQDAAV